jgi:RNA polymerase sigma factor (sigma-70 family)
MKSVLLGIPAQHFDVAPGQTLWPLLVTIVLNKIRDRARKYSGPRRNLAKQDRLENYSLLAAGEGAHSQVELDDLIQHLLAGFPPRRRRIMELLLEGHRTGEIAQEMGVSERTVYNTHQQAKDSLAELLSRQSQ